LELLKVGGKLSYSTCSLNPIENESVVAALLKMYGNKIRLLETGLNGFKF
jgi:16S rRNA C967 or C1407 C5-methylase (RsmB/RsmF family)